MSARDADTDAVASPAATQALARLRAEGGAAVATHVSRETGVYNFVHATGSAVLYADDTSAKPEARALAFLSAHGDLVGMTKAERDRLANPNASDAARGSQLRADKVFTDSIGDTHVRVNQFYQGKPVFGAQLVVHMNDQGITALNGDYMPGINVSTTPNISEAAAARSALTALRKELGNVPLKVVETGLSIYRTGLLEGYRGQNVLAYGVKVSDSMGLFRQVWIDAKTGAILNNIPLRHDALNRRVYSPKYDSSNPDLFVVRKEEDLVPSPIPAIEGLFQFTGQAYRLFHSGFGRDSYDGNGATMRTVYLVNSVCPNAYWDGSTTNYCPDIDADDVVAHEWTHGYTQYTHDLVYSFQSGALNEAYSDIFGETVDLLNGADGQGGSDNAHPTIYTFDDNSGQYIPTGGGVRWRIGEDVAGLNQPAALGILRDMWQPTIFGDPDKVSSTSYHCGADDGGGVHTNSGVPNHAFALLVDGTTALPDGKYNGQAVAGIGLIKALHIYFRAMSVYQTPTTNFAGHEQALRASCTDLIGKPLNGLSTDSATGTPSGEVITASDCQSVANAMAAVEMSKRPEQCHFGPLLDPNTPLACNGATTVFSEDWETGMDGWTLASTGSFAGWPGFNWKLDSSLPAGRAGTAAFAEDSSGGICGDPNGDRSGHFSIDSPSINVPAGATDLKMSFDHFIATEFQVDGGNVLISKNGGAFTLVPQSSYIFNAPSSQLRAAPPTDQNTNPKAGEFAWSGADPEVGAFGTTIINLSSLVAPGDNFKIRFELGMDGCGGNEGWYVDNVRVYSCPTLAPPVLSIGTGYENPDTNGSYELKWTRPTGATGPDTLQESTSCAPLFADDAENGLDKWNLTTEGTGAFDWESSTVKPQHDGTAFWGRAAEGAMNASSIMTSKDKVTIPAAGTTSLTFSDWNINESDDRVYVEVSENGTNWSILYTNDRSELAPDASEFFGTEPLSQRQIDLTTYHGKAIYLRFRFTAGPDDKAGSTPFGWYVDDISINNDDWSDVTTVNGTSFTVSKRKNGNYCYRVRTSYTFGSSVVPSPNSNLVGTKVERILVPPATSIASPLEGAVFASGSNIALKANATDSDGTIKKVEFFRGNTKIGEDVTGPNYTFAWNSVPTGSYQLTSKATDDDGLTTTSAPVNITVKRIGLVSFTLSPTAVTGGCDQGSRGTVTLDGKAPAGGTVVTLSSSNTNLATVPANITIPAGATSYTFPVRTKGVNDNQSVNITARLGTNNIRQALTLRPGLIRQVTLSPNPVMGGKNVTGVIRLECGAPAGGTLVNLSSSQPGVAKPTVESLTIPAGVMSKQFSIRTFSVTSAKTPTIKATTPSNGKTAAAVLRVNPQ